MNSVSYPEDNLNFNDFLHTEDRGDFHIGQSYTTKVATTIICNKCGADEFIVGSGEYYTAIKCKTCGYEVAIHEG